MISTGVISVDDGGHSTCVVTKDGTHVFPSVKSAYGQRNLIDIKGKYDFIVDYKGQRYVMGDLAKFDSRYQIQMHTDTKQNTFFDLSVLTSVHQYGFSVNYLVVSVPISLHNSDEKLGRIKRLTGEHVITVNGMQKKINIADVKVAPETAVAFWVNEPEGKTRYLDIGSRTVGYATTIFQDGITRFIDSESGTFEHMGIEALDKQYDPTALSEHICGKLFSLWKENDNVNILGGGALDERLVKEIKTYFPNAVAMKNPQLVNANGMYLLGRVAYKML